MIFCFSLTCKQRTDWTRRLRLKWPERRGNFRFSSEEPCWVSSQLQSLILKGEKRLLKKPTSFVLKRSVVSFLYIRRQSCGDWKKGVNFSRHGVWAGGCVGMIALSCLTGSSFGCLEEGYFPPHLSGGSDSGQQTESNCRLLLPPECWLHHYKVIITRHGQKLEGTMGIINDSLHQVHFFPSSLKFNCYSIAAERFIVMP